MNAETFGEEPEFKTEENLAWFIKDKIEESYDHNRTLRVETGEEAGFMTSDTMLVVNLGGEEFHLTIAKR
tara:strand:+ start:225 stop:434 length:210 start_codon:yes stop_codon:yes gene_type:complete